MRRGVCPLCAHRAILAVDPVEFGGDNRQWRPAATYRPRRVLSGLDPSHPLGLIKVFVCRHCGYAQSFVDRPQDVPVGEAYHTALLDCGDPPGGRRIQTVGAALYLGDLALEQHWPDGSVHQIVFGSPFESSCHLGGTSSEGLWCDVHVKLVQDGSLGRAVVAFTARVEPSEAIVGLPTATASLPRIEGSEAEALLSRLGPLW